jgi:hypothetical protein
LLLCHCGTGTKCNSYYTLSVTVACAANEPQACHRHAACHLYGFAHLSNKYSSWLRGAGPPAASCRASGTSIPFNSLQTHSTDTPMMHVNCCRGSASGGGHRCCCCCCSELSGPQDAQPLRMLSTSTTLLCCMMPSQPATTAAIVPATGIMCELLYLGPIGNGPMGPRYGVFVQDLFNSVGTAAQWHLLAPQVTMSNFTLTRACPVSTICSAAPAAQSASNSTPAHQGRC